MYRGLTVLQVVGVLACGTGVWAAAMKAAVEPVLSYPTEKAPFVQGRDTAKRTALQKEVVELLKAPVEKISAHPAAACARHRPRYSVLMFRYNRTSAATAGSLGCHSSLNV